MLLKWPPSATLALITAIAMLKPSLVASVAIDNDIVGEPEIECLEEEIRVWIKSRKYFAGRIYAKGRAEDPACFKVQDDFASERTTKPHYDLRFGACGMKGLRSLDPRGMYYGITVVVSFHPMFITKVDQAFHVKCFFEESNRGLTAELGVSMIPTTEVEARHGIPGCTYSIHRSSIQDLDQGMEAGPPIQFARVGDKVLHQWHCDDQMFGVLINNCYVTDGFGKRADVVDANGCPVDPILITGIRYSQDLQRAYAESHVFKFADKPGVWFFCQIQMCMKAPGMCNGVTPPSCASVTPGSSSTVDQTIGEDRYGPGHISGGSSNGSPPPSLSIYPGEGEGEGLTGFSSGSEFGGHGDFSSHSGSPTGPTKDTTRPSFPSESSGPFTPFAPGFTIDGLGGPGSSVGNTHGGLPEDFSIDDDFFKARGAAVRSQEAVTAVYETNENVNRKFLTPTRSSGSTPSQMQSLEPTHFSRLPTTRGFGGTTQRFFDASPTSGFRSDSTTGVTTPTGGFHMDTDSPEKSADSSSSSRGTTAQRTTTDWSQAHQTAGFPDDDFGSDFGSDFGNGFGNGFGSSGFGSGPFGSGGSDFGGGSLPPELSDLLNELPEDIDLESLKDIFKDSVDDRRALMRQFKDLMGRLKTGGPNEAKRRRPRPAKKSRSGRGSSTRVAHPDGRPGDKLDSFEVSWDSGRPPPSNFHMMADSPFEQYSGEPEPYVLKAPEDAMIAGELPQIAGQLIVFDLDEDPPSYMQVSTNQLEGVNGTVSASSNDEGQKGYDITLQRGGFDPSSSSQCVISRQGLTKLALLLGGMAAIFFFMTMFLCLRAYRNGRQSKNHLLANERQAIPYNKYNQDGSSANNKQQQSRGDRSRDQSNTSNNHRSRHTSRTRR